ncbi:MAG TPA: hypothetical protein VKA46_36545 [Gemmataceae bacterium]|nr:hypothetical protein [Gemmataceae bacterium]
MAHAPIDFTLDTLLRKKIEKLRRQQKDARLHNRLSALLWLGQGRTPEEVAELLGVSPVSIGQEVVQYVGQDGRREWLPDEGDLQPPRMCDGWS